jgi:hypothetical protein
VGVSKHGAVGVAVEGDAEAGFELLRFGSDNVGMQRAAVRVDITAVGSGVGELEVSAEMSEELRGNGRGGSIGAVENDLKAIEVQTRERAAEELLVIFAIFLVDARRRTGVWCCEILEAAKDFSFDAKLGFVG